MKRQIRSGMVGGVLILLEALQALAAQPALVISTNSQVYPGATLSVTVGLTGSSGANIAGVGFVLPAGASNLALGTAASAANKSLFTGNQTVLLLGWQPGGSSANATVITDGPLLTFTFQVPAGQQYSSTLTIGLSSSLASSAAGATVPITVSPLSVMVTVSTTCVSAIQNAVAAFETSPTQLLLNQITGDLVAAMAGGACQ